MPVWHKLTGTQEAYASVWVAWDDRPFLILLRYDSKRMRWFLKSPLSYETALTGTVPFDAASAFPVANGWLESQGFVYLF